MIQTKRESFTIEKYTAGGWKRITRNGSILQNTFIKNLQFFYSYGGDYFNISLLRAPLEVVLEYEAEVPDNTFNIGNRRTVRCRGFLETSGKMRFWTSDWQITQPMLAAAPYFLEWSSEEFIQYVNSVGKYVLKD